MGPVWAIVSKCDKKQILANYDKNSKLHVVIFFQERPVTSQKGPAGRSLVATGSGDGGNAIKGGVILKAVQKLSS
jgi:hypothetical protein